MIMKSCPISNMLNIKKDHCNMCKKDNFYLKDTTMNNVQTLDVKNSKVYGDLTILAK